MSAGGVTDARPGHLLVASRGPWAGPGVERFLSDAAALAGTGTPVTVALIADATALALPGGSADLVTLLDAGVAVLVDRFSAAQRGVAGMDLPAGARWVDADELAVLLLEPDVPVVWH
ncbi:hypothetical protein [Saccharothrix hoggarensis]|uniref:DsrE/DsrF/DsrH-like protein n=1 Tax=Saccharothrix hoggarensis TaxID=913853 RepID=A0ABW3QS15_9PSEU